MSYDNTDPLGQTIDYETDALGRILKKHVLDPRRPDGIHTENIRMMMPVT